ncbi:MAG TPA: UvrD-helicase domain-containing protein [bacterium]|jgi:exodeoxyribonuclease V beta subunit|nr:UvrD-helicase domain-containing protein [bacterium]
MSEFKLCETEIPRGLSVIEASAGTGKTWTLGHLLPRLLIDGRIDSIDQALMLSYTEESTRELAERVRHYLGGLAQLLLDQDPHPSASPDLAGLIQAAAAAAAPDQEGLRQLLELLAKKKPEAQPQLVRNILRAQLDCDRLSVSTIHALCQRVLSDEGFLCGTPTGFEVLPDLSDLKLEALRDTWRSRLASDPALAALAVREGWRLDRDLKAWNLLDLTDSGVLHGEPKELDAVLDALRGALERMRASAQDLLSLEQILAGDVTKNKKAEALDAKGRLLLLQGMDPALPGFEALDQVEWLGSADECLRKRINKNVEPAERIRALPLVAAAGLAAQALHELDWAWRKEALAAAKERLRRRLLKANALSFNDLITRLHEALQGPAGGQIAGRLRKRWKVALVDESQDSDPRQLAIFEKIFNAPAELEQSLVLIGDPKQSIYGFRGADIEAYENARDRRPRILVSELVRTHRSAEGLVAALNRLFDLPDPLGSPKLRLPKAEAVRSDAELPLPDGERARLVAALVGEGDAPLWSRSGRRVQGAAEAAARAVAALLGKKAGRERVEPGQCAVLTRSNTQAQAVREALGKLGVAAVVRDDEDVFAGEEAADLALVMRAALKPAARGFRRAALATRMLGFTAADLGGLDEERERAWQLRFSSLGDAWRRGGVAAFLAALDKDGGLSKALACGPLGERRLTDLRHLGDVLQAEEAARGLAPDRLVEWMQAAMAGAGERVAPPQRLQRLETDSSAVQVLTIHRAKGLEFDYVFCPFLWTARVPKAGEMRVAKLGGRRGLADPSHLKGEDAAALWAEAGWLSLEEELRLAYVALTRARRRIWLLAGYIGYSKGNAMVPPSALDWLLRQPREESREAWYARMAEQKKPLSASGSKRAHPYLCEHGQRLAWLAQDPRIQWEALSLEGKPYQAPPAGVAELRPSLAPSLKLRVWRLTSYSGIVRGPGQSPDRDVHDRAREPEPAERTGPDVALAAFARGAEAGEGLHQLLEAWNFQGPAPDLVRRVLERNGLAKATPLLEDPVQCVEAFLPDLAGALIPGLGSLAQTADQPGLSEWHFVLPLAQGGLDGRALAEVFAGHPDARMRDYAASLKGLAPEAVQGMLQGYIDRLARRGKLWAVVDWKSNHLGTKAADYTQEALWACATADHYVLQVHLYMAALRRYLLQSGGGHRVHGAALAFLRGMRAGTSEGILFFPADEAFLARLDGLFLGGAA